MNSGGVTRICCNCETYKAETPFTKDRLGQSSEPTIRTYADLGSSISTNLRMAGARSWATTQAPTFVWASPSDCNVARHDASRYSRSGIKTTFLLYTAATDAIEAG